jgi:23S rRNA pseudouridine1911/1915/1917 synthase
MVFARSVEAERHLGKQFRKHTIERRYLAIVKGIVSEQTISTHLVRDRGDKRRGNTTLPGVGKRAVTHVKPVEVLRGHTLVECQLETGRTHQIRIHLAELGHPVAGDKVYNQPLFKPVIPDDSGAPRVMLHAAELGFEHPITGEKLHFKQPLPGDIEGVLRRLRKG